MMPHESEAQEDLEKVDCHFVIIGVDKDLAKQCKEKLVSILEDYPNPEHLQGEASYIDVGAVLGSQDAALRLFALGKVLGLWELVIPSVIGIEGDLAEEMARRGFVSIMSPEKAEEVRKVLSN